MVWDYFKRPLEDLKISDTANRLVQTVLVCVLYKVRICKRHDPLDDVQPSLG
jgi:hypothetical protein